MGFRNIPTDQTCRLTTVATPRNQNIQTAIAAMTVLTIYSLLPLPNPTIRRIHNNTNC